MSLRLTALLLAMVLLSTSCGFVPDVKESIIDDTVKVNSDNTGIEKKIRTAEGDFSSVLVDFSDEIYHLVSDDNDKKENIIFSPLSVVYALALSSNGADGQTLNEFEELFGGLPAEMMNEYLLSLTNELESSKDTKVVIGNSIWANKRLMTLSSDYLDIAKKYYSAEARSLEFNEQAVSEINNWVREKTDGLIDKVIDELSPNMVIALFNTVLFDGKWAKKYDEYSITEGKFFNYDGTETDVEYLYSEETGTYFEVDGGVGFSKAYKDGYRFTAVLPDGDIDEFIKNENIGEILNSSAASGINVRVYIPKFEYDYSTSLNKILQSMGLNTAFTDSADFDKMSESGKANIMISQIFQKAKIILNEEGTKAAAVTGITYATCALPTAEVKRIRLERPFFYIIQDINGNPLFVGTVYSLD